MKLTPIPPPAAPSATAASHLPEPVFHDPRHHIKIFQGDCLDILAAIPEATVDLIFADPPYFLSNDGITCHAGRMVSVNKGQWDRSRGPDANHHFNRAWLAACQRLLKPNGSIWVSGTAHVIHSVGFAMQQLGFKLLNDISWVKPNPPPNLSCRYFTHATETLIWAAKNKKSRHTFHYKLMKEHAGGKQMKSVWTIRPPEPSEKRFGKHPTQQPVALLERILLASSDPDAPVPLLSIWWLFCNNPAGGNFWRYVADDAANAEANTNNFGHRPGKPVRAWGSEKGETLLGCIESRQTDAVVAGNTS